MNGTVAGDAQPDLDVIARFAILGASVPIDRLISNLKRVKQVAPGHYKACCPAHDDRTPSLSITEQPDGRILIHCFAGCTPADVVSAAGATMADLFPEPPPHEPRKPIRNAFGGADAIMRELLRDIRVIHDTAILLADGEALSYGQADRFLRAYANIDGHFPDRALRELWAATLKEFTVVLLLVCDDDQSNIHRARIAADRIAGVVAKIEGDRERD